jgi:hypothetical protein
VTAELVRVPLPPVSGSDQPYCPFCAGVMVVAENRKTVVCVACGCDALIEDGPQ